MPKKKFAAFDIDGTLYRDALYHDLVWELIEMGVLPEDAIHEFSEEFHAWKTRQGSETFNTYVEAHVEYYEKRLPNITLEQYLESINRLFEKKKGHVHRFTRDLIKQLKDEGYFLIAISGSQVEVVEKFAEYYGFDDWVGQVHEREGDGFTGKTEKTYKGKEKFVEEMVKKHDLDMTDSIAIGDSFGDIGMLEFVEKPIAFNPEKILLKKAQEEGWEVVIERKNVTYKLSPEDGHYVLAETIS